MNWYKKQLKTASVSFWVADSNKITQPMNKSDICNDLSKFVFYDLKIGEKLGFKWDDFDPDMSSGNVSDTTGQINIYIKNPNIKQGIIKNILEHYNKYKELINLKLLKIDTSGLNPGMNTARVLIEKNDTANLDQIPEMNISNANAEALISLLNNEGMENLDPYGGSINIDVLKNIISSIEQNNFLLNSYTQESTEEKNPNESQIIEFGRSYKQMERYINSLKEMIRYIDENNLPVKKIDYG